MKKVINPCTCEVYTSRGTTQMENAYVEIEYTDGRLSLHGVIGPRVGGNCMGSCGQCDEEISKGVPTEDWTQEMLEKLCDVWDKWHLNDMRAYCQHQKELGWREQAREKITLYRYRLKDEARKKKKEAEKAALQALRNGEKFTPTEEQVFFAVMADSVEQYEELSSPYYEPYNGVVYKPTETKTRGWVRYDESDKGILCKPCPVCGYEYGSAWLKEEVPQEIIDWLFALPTTKTKPAWV